MFLWTVLFSISQATTISTAMRLGDCESVSSQPAQQPSEHLAHARCALQDTDWDKAIQSASLVTQGVFHDYARWVEANAYLEQNNPAAASESLKNLSIPGPLKTEVPLMRGKALILAGRSLEAREGLRALLSTNVAAEARYWLARGGEDRGDMGPAIATYEHVWAHNVRGPWDEQSAERLNALGAAVPDVNTARGIQLLKTRMAALNKERQYGEALTLLRILHQVEPPTTKDHHLEHARAIFKARNYEESVLAFRRVMGSPENATGSANDLFNYGLAQARAGDYDSAMVIYGRLIQQHPKTKRADFGSFKRGYTEYDRRNLKPAIQEFQRHIQDRKDSKYLDEAIWFLGLCHWLDNAPEKATKVWLTLEKNRPKSPLVPAASYWIARLKGLEGDKQGEKLGYEDLLKKHPTAGHTWYAAFRLGHTFPKKERVTAPDWPASFATRNDVQRADALLNAGFPQWARNEMTDIQKVAEGSGKEARLAAAWRFIAAGDYRVGQKLARPFCVKPWKGGDPIAQQACYPMPEAPIVDQVVNDYDIDPYLPYGVMTAESLLKPWVTSHAGARGLMQLMPKVGERLAKEVFPEKAYHPDQLYAASFNARLGTTELGQRTKALNGILSETSLPAIIASYNGGEAAVRRWASTFEEPPPFDAFAETIGYAETRRYVRRVLNFIMMYRWVYGDPSVTSDEP